MGLANKMLKSIIKSIVPESVLAKMQFALSVPKIIRAKRAFNRASTAPEWLGRDELESLQKQYPFIHKYRYDKQSLKLRGSERAAKIISLIRAEKANVKNLLELGCWDGMVCAALQRKGYITTAIDNRSEGFAEEAEREGVKLLQMDAAHLVFENESFDFVFSFDGFEHFAEPELVLQEATRVVKTGGNIYLDFGPLYMSPGGLHAYRSITIPYCQFLFPLELLKSFAKEKGLLQNDFTYINKWPLEDFHNLWLRYSDSLKRIIYREKPAVKDLDLIIKYPSCFRSKTDHFESLLISSIEVLFKKIG
jgi:ubiquinone/menaquinone biosynthesis C-methylase UbiE